MPKIDFKIGCDPEFACLKSNNRYVPAYNDYKNGIGGDGSALCFEARPEPSYCPLEVTRNIREILVSHLSQNPKFFDYRWIAGSYLLKNRISLGGHIHFGIFATDPYKASLILSQYVGAFSVLLENKKEGLRRRYDGYGFIQDYRDQNWGFEYRTLGSWLTSPYITSGFLCLAKVVLSEILNNKNFEPINLFDNEDFVSMKVSNFRHYLETVWTGIKSMELYPKYKNHIDILYKLIINNKTWHPNVDMKEAWGLTFGDTLKNKVSLDSIWI